MKDLSWFIGVVEDRNDPVQIGRVRVRCFGYHTDDKSRIATEDLPWAQVMLPTTSASISGIGHSPSGLLPGSWVVGFFIDGKRAQEPVIIGSVPGAPDKFPDTNFGFCDPSGEYPTYIGKDTSLKSRGIDDARIAVNSIFNIPDPFAAQYPYNHVCVSESGHFKEYDDTPGAERTREQHKSGTYVEIDVSGNRVVHVVGTDFDVVVGDKNIDVKGNVNINVEGRTTITSQLTTINGNVRIDGELSVRGDVKTDSGISHNDHTHLDTAGTGIGKTSGPK